jgi:hypothetical protein
VQKSLSLSLSLSPKPSLRDGEKESIGAHFLRLWADRRKGKRERATRVVEFALDGEKWILACLNPIQFNAAFTYF